MIWNSCPSGILVELPVTREGADSRGSRYRAVAQSSAAMAGRAEVLKHRRAVLANSRPGRPEAGCAVPARPAERRRRSPRRAAVLACAASVPRTGGWRVSPSAKFAGRLARVGEEWAMSGRNSWFGALGAARNEHVCRHQHDQDQQKQVVQSPPGAASGKAAGRSSGARISSYPFLDLHGMVVSQQFAHGCRIERGVRLLDHQGEAIVEHAGNNRQRLLPAAGRGHQEQAAKTVPKPAASTMPSKMIGTNAGSEFQGLPPTFSGQLTAEVHCWNQSMNAAGQPADGRRPSLPRRPPPCCRGPGRGPCISGWATSSIFQPAARTAATGAEQIGVLLEHGNQDASGHGMVNA